MTSRRVLHISRRGPKQNEKVFERIYGRWIKHVEGKIVPIFILEFGLMLYYYYFFFFLEDFRFLGEGYLWKNSYFALFVFILLIFLIKTKKK